MTDLLKWLNKYGVMVIIFLLLVIYLTTCSQNSRLNTNIENTAAIMVSVDSVTNQIKSSTDRISNIERNTYNKEETDLVLEINGYKVSKRMLYDNNAIIRKITRPDDQMNAYDVKIDSLSVLLKRLNKR